MREWEGRLGQGVGVCLVRRYNGGGGVEGGGRGVIGLTQDSLYPSSL